MSRCWMQTVSGKAVDFDDLDPSAIDIADIALGLSRIARYVGHTATAEPYSVAEHSVRVARLVAWWQPNQPELALRALLHDAAEGYVGDTTSPVKAWVRRQTYALDVLEARVERAILTRFGLRHLRSDPPLPLDELERIEKVIKRADLVLLATERRDHMAPCDRDWELEHKPLAARLAPPLSASAAERVFLEYFEAMTAAVSLADAEAQR
jgi:uncharacterized protein